MSTLEATTDAPPTETTRLIVYDDSHRRPGELRRSELFWRDHSVWLREQGYILRPRFQVDWVPSWRGKDKLWWECEDGLILRSSQLVDAIRAKDGASVMLKRVFKELHPHEAELASSFSTPPLSSSPDNHVAPILAVLQSPHDENAQIFVMPFLRSFADPRFDTFGEAVSFFEQIFRGLAFLHKHNLAHRDCNANNIMMDASSLYTSSWHAVKTGRTPDLKKNAPHYTRTQCPVRYYLIDLGISRRYTSREDAAHEPIIMGGDKSPPEHQGDAYECDPFPTDVYFMGNMIRQNFLQNKLGFEFMVPLVEDMINPEPSARPLMADVVTRFAIIRSSLNTGKLRSRIVNRDDSSLFGFFRCIAHWSRRLVYAIRRVPPIPQPPPRML